MKKFAAIGTFTEDRIPHELIKVLGLQGYYRQNEPLYLVQVDLLKVEDSLGSGLKLQIPLQYKKRNQQGKFERALNFGEGVPPGYTSAGVAEVVFSTFALRAAGLNGDQSLGTKGIQLIPATQDVTESEEGS